MPHLNLLRIPTDLLLGYEAQNYLFGNIESNPALSYTNVNPKEKISTLVKKEITSDLSKSIKTKLASPSVPKMTEL